MRQRFLAELSAFLFAVLFGFSQSWGHPTGADKVSVDDSVQFEARLSHQSDLMVPGTFSGFQLGERSRVKVLSDNFAWDFGLLRDSCFPTSFAEVLYRNLQLKWDLFSPLPIYLKNRVLIL
jgi:hypothetical protein